MRPDSGCPPALLAAAADVAPPIVHVSTTAKQCAWERSFERKILERNITADGIVTTQVQQGSKEQQQRDSDLKRPDSGWPPALLAAASDVAPPIVHVSTTAEQTAEKIERNIPADGIVTDKNGVRLGYKDLEWNKTRGVWVPVAAK